MNFDLANSQSTATDSAATSVAAAEGGPRRVFSEQLIGPGREILIRHAGCDYRLRITRQGKLILTK